MRVGFAGKGEKRTSWGVIIDCILVDIWLHRCIHLSELIK